MNKLEKAVSELSQHYKIPTQAVDDALRVAIHSGMHLVNAECFFIDLANRHAETPLYKTWTIEDLMDANGKTRQEIVAELERIGRENPGKVTSYTFPAGLFKQRPTGDFLPNPDDPGTAMLTARGIMMIALLDEKDGNGSPKTAKMARRIFEIIAGNGYHLDAQPLQCEIMARSIEDIKSWIRAVYDVFISSQEVMDALQTL